MHINDIVTKFASRRGHIDHLRELFERMRKHGLKMNPLKCAFDVQASDFLGFVVHKKGIKINQNKTKVIMDVKLPSTIKELQSLLGKINFLRRFILNLSGKTQAFSPFLRLKKEKFEWKPKYQVAFDRIKEYMAWPPILSPLCRNICIRLCISTSNMMIESILAQEDDKGVE